MYMCAYRKREWSHEKLLFRGCPAVGGEEEGRGRHMGRRCLAAQHARYTYIYMYIFIYI